MATSVLALVASALDGSGLNLVGGATRDAFDARAPEGFRSGALFPRARGVVVVASGGRELWSRFRVAYASAAQTWARAEHPLDAFVAGALARADAAFAGAGIAFCRFEPTLYAEPALDFRALGELAGLGTPGPFGMLIHATYGPWWALRGAYLVDAEVAVARAPPAPCEGCAAPCVGGRRTSGLIDLATPDARRRCVVGPEHRYEDEQIAYHYGGARPPWMAQLAR